MCSTRFLLFTSLVKHGELLRYLLAAQVRKRLMEQYQMRRQVKSSAVTGNPDRLFEVYYVENWDRLEENLLELMNDASFVSSQALIEETRITLKDRVAPLDIPPPVQVLSQMPYLLEDKSQEECAQGLADDPHLLHVTCTLHKNEDLDEFNTLMRKLLKVFKWSGLELLVAGQQQGELTIDLAHKSVSMNDLGDASEQKPITILNIWQYEDPESPRKLMARLAENQTYSRLDMLCDQDQHICRNVSRHYQLYPLLQGHPQFI